MTTSSVREDLVLTKGNTVPIQLDFLDENGNPESLTLADKAQFAIKESTQSTTPVFSWDTDAGNLTIDVPNSRLTAVLTLAQSENLPVGVFLGQSVVRFGSEEDWRYSEIFQVKILPAVAERI